MGSICVRTVYTVGRSGRVAYFEASADKVAGVGLVSDAGFICHTNHPLANDDYSREGAKLPSRTREIIRGPDIRQWRKIWLLILAGT